MIATIVTFRHGPETYDRQRLEAISHSTAPKYRGWRDSSRRRTGTTMSGESTAGSMCGRRGEAAEAVHTPEHAARLESLYGVRPEVRYIDAPIFVNNG
ncbi:MAG: hypothetical protein M5U18_05890 [Dehalococcoidia bacterium]|nr:hypothetical protein [Dehalococcoidia bacterium]